MVVCIRQFTPQTEEFGLQMPYLYSLILNSKVSYSDKGSSFLVFEFQMFIRRLKV